MPAGRVYLLVLAHPSLEEEHGAAAVRVLDQFDVLDDALRALALHSDASPCARDALAVEAYDSVADARVGRMASLHIL